MYKSCLVGIFISWYKQCDIWYKQIHFLGKIKTQLTLKIMTIKYPSFHIRLLKEISIKKVMQTMHIIYVLNDISWNIYIYVCKTTYTSQKAISLMLLEQSWIIFYAINNSLI